MFNLFTCNVNIIKTVIVSLAKKNQQVLCYCYIKCDSDVFVFFLKFHSPE